MVNNFLSDEEWARLGAVTPEQKEKALKESGGQELLYRRQAIRYNISPQKSLFKYSIN